MMPYQLADRSRRLEPSADHERQSWSLATRSAAISGSGRFASNSTRSRPESVVSSRERTPAAVARDLDHCRDFVALRPVWLGARRPGGAALRCPCAGISLEESRGFTSSAYLMALYVAARHFAQASDLYGPIETPNPETRRGKRQLDRLDREVDVELLRTWSGSRPTRVPLRAPIRAWAEPIERSAAAELDGTLARDHAPATFRRATTSLRANVSPRQFPTRRRNAAAHRNANSPLTSAKRFHG
jgi:hypothetical protein